MPKKDPRIDAAIQKAAPFAKPILTHLREVVHRNCPQAEETLKWGMPHFLYDGRILCAMAAFKAHCTFGFWNGALIVKGDGSKSNMAMGQMGRLTKVADLPSDRVLASYIKQAMKLSEAGASPKQALKRKRPPAKPPAEKAVDQISEKKSLTWKYERR